jgi:hypothetical protein
MTTFQCNGKQAYIDDRLASELRLVAEELKYEDSDSVFAIDGGEGSGKSKFADIVAGFMSVELGVHYSEENFCLSPSQFRAAILAAKKNGIIIYDEAHKGMGSRRSMSEINNILNDLMMEMRQKNLFVLLVLPTFFMLDKYAAIFRTRGLFHVYRGKDPKTGKRKRGFWVFFNHKYKLFLYIKGKQYFNYNCVDWPGFRGVFFKQYLIDEAKYRQKKRESFNQHAEAPRKEDNWRIQRNKAIFCLYKTLKIGAPKLTTLLSSFGLELSQSSVEDAIMEAKGGKKPIKEEKYEETEENDEESEENEPE